VNKYRAVRTKLNGYTLDSKAEARRYGELLLMQKAGEITDLKVHPEFYLAVNGIEVCKYVGDFGYWKDGKYVLEDVKGVRTAIYRLKKKLMLAVLAIVITEVSVKGRKTRSREVAS